MGEAGSGAANAAPSGTAASTANRQGGNSGAQALLSSTLAGVVIALSSVITGIGVAALAFPGDLQPWLFTVLGTVLFSALVYMVVTSLLGSYAGTIALPQEAPAAVLGLLATALAPGLTGRLGAEAAVAAIIIAIGATTVLTGLAFYLLGRLRLGGLIRFIPYPVVGGVLAGLGWLLLQGAISVLTGLGLTVDALPGLASGDNPVRIGIGLAIGVLLLVVTRRVKHYLVLPGVLIVCIAGFYAGAAALGVDVGTLSEAGWLLGPFPAGLAWSPPSIEAVVALDWTLLAAEVATIGTVVLISAISILLYASGIELMVRSDLDLDHELRVVGLANFLAGLSGGVPGFHSMSDTLLAKEMHALRRLTGLIAAAILATVLFAGFWLLAYFPKPVLGGLLFYLGLTLLIEWIYGAWFRLPRGDYVIVLTILVVAAWFGYLPGIGVGIVAGIVLFVVNYSRLGVTKYAVSGVKLRSNVDRSSAERQVLEQFGNRIQVFALQGFLFFGSANKVLESVRERVFAHGGEIDYVVIDFRLVDGLDSSSLLTLRKLEQFAEERDFRLVITTLSPVWLKALEDEGIGSGAETPVKTFVDLDHGLEWCEERLLRGTGAIPDEDQPALPTALLERLEPYLESQVVPFGDHLMRQGEASDDMYFLRSGRVTVRLDDSRRLRSYGPGTVVGEIAMFLGTPRSASVIADEPTTLARLTRDELDRMAEEDPALAEALMRYLVTQMCERLANTNALLQSVL